MNKGSCTCDRTAFFLELAPLFYSQRKRYRKFSNTGAEILDTEDFEDDDSKEEKSPSPLEVPVPSAFEAYDSIFSGRKKIKKINPIPSDDDIED